MIQLIKEQIGEIPVLHAVQEGFHEQVLPTVIYYHGYNGEKISSLTLAYMMAEKGIRVVLPDSPNHGERSQNLSAAESDLAFWDTVTQNIDEIPKIATHLIQQNQAVQNRIGVGGTSMGAITTYGALVKYDWIKTGVSLMGTAYMTDYASTLIDYYNEHHDEKISKNQEKDVYRELRFYDLSKQLHKLNERPLLIWHGEEDNVVPYCDSPKIYQAFQEVANQPEYIKLVSEPGRAHHVSRLAMHEAANWFNSFV